LQICKVLFFNYVPFSISPGNLLGDFFYSLNSERDGRAVASTVHALVRCSFVEELVHCLFALPSFKRLVALGAHAFALAFDLPSVGIPLDLVSTHLARLRPTRSDDQNETYDESRDAGCRVQGPEVNDPADDDEGEAPGG
jgi:hypothetical protein